jgi:hypothetical protein
MREEVLWGADQSRSLLMSFTMAWEILGGPGLVIGLKAGDRNLQPVDGIQCA